MKPMHQLTRKFVFHGSLLGALALVTACGSDDSGGDGSGGAGGQGGSSGGGAGGMGGSGNTGGTQLMCTEGASLDVSGTWVGAVRLSVQMDSIAGGAITICPANQVAEASLLMLFDIQQSPTDPGIIDSISSVVCDIALPEVTAIVGACDPNPSNLIKTQLVVPPALQALIPNIQLDPVTGTLSGTTPGSTISPQRVSFIAGATGQPLPTWDIASSACNNTTSGRTSACDDTCVSDCSVLTDDDADGFPGISLGVCGRSEADETQGVPCNIDDPAEAGVTVQGKAWLNLIVDPLLNGTVDSSCEMSGTADATLVYNIVGADVFLSNGPVGVTVAIQSLPNFTIVPANSPFRMVRIDGANGAPDWGVSLSDRLAACTTAVSRQGELF